MEMDLPKIGLGCWELGGGDYWGPTSQAEADAIVREAVELGVTYFDTAEAYNEGRSEESLGIALRGIPREQVTIGTKISPSNTEPAALVAHCEASLRRLGVEYVDLYMVHWPITPDGIAHFTDAPVRPSVEAAFETLCRLREQGKVRHIGVSNFGVARLAEALSLARPIAVNQLCYSLVSRAAEAQVLPRCREAGVGVIAYMVLQQGLLTGRYASLQDVPSMFRRTRHFDSRRPNSLARHGGPGFEAELTAALSRLEAIAVEVGRSMADLATAWVASTPGIACALVGSRSPRHLRSAVEAVRAPLPPQLRSALDEATRTLMEAMGPSLDFFQSPESDRTL
jgi:aryl-alcohol dehydrogenase-like predicted oxidoreductase